MQMEKKNTGEKEIRLNDMWKDVEVQLPEKNGFYNVKLDTDNGVVLHSCWFKDGMWYYDNYLMEGEPLFAMGWYAKVLEWKPLDTTEKIRGLSIGDTVRHHDYSNERFKVIGIRADEIELEGDWSGGTHHTVGRCWVDIKFVINDQ